MVRLEEQVRCSISRTCYCSNPPSERERMRGDRGGDREGSRWREGGRERDGGRKSEREVERKRNEGREDGERLFSFCVNILL